MNSLDRNIVFERLINKSDKCDLDSLSEESINHLSRLFGEFCRDKIRYEADQFRFKRTHEDANLSSSEILSNIGHKCVRFQSFLKPKKIRVPKKFEIQKFFGPKKFWVPNNFWIKKFWVPKSFRSQNVLGPRKFWVQKNLIIY